MEKVKKITILGSTGSIGTQALEVISKLKDKFEIIALSAGDNIELLSQQIEQYNPRIVCAKSKQSADKLKQKYPNILVVYGETGLVQICKNKDNDIILVAVSGRIGLKPTLAAIKNGIDIALANKETLVMAGDIVMKMAKENNVRILPVDSEHSAIHQSIKDRKSVRNLIITASGGPFKNSTPEEIKKATVKEALAHPRWNMGKKITVDSATLMNKGLEVIEAHHLFNMHYENIKVVIHPQSVIHSAVEHIDGSVIAQLGVPSMHIPIQYAITYPNRVEGIKTDSFDFVKIGRLDFSEPDYEKFPCLKLAFNAGKLGGTYPVCLNAANEEAVFAFLEGKISLYQIYEITKKMMDAHDAIQNPTIDEIFEIDEKIREKTRKLISENI
ncbi:MAG: 1-deoxy-D-xylulose-5-phosphate reductoisomerase [Candidatus Gastranaerophilales bacterium]|nr:1-deoxy-D-xylulose-5-phosphate reductoisomerase [Candidatus Gastranaerophilales bacterium]